jgi:hypothetical protein
VLLRGNGHTVEVVVTSVFSENGAASRRSSEPRPPCGRQSKPQRRSEDAPAPVSAGAHASYFLLAGAFLAAVRFAGALRAAGFFAGAFLAAVLFAGAFLAAGFLAAGFFAALATVVLLSMESRESAHVDIVIRLIS